MQRATDYVAYGMHNGNSYLYDSYSVTDIDSGGMQTKDTKAVQAYMPAACVRLPHTHGSLPHKSENMSLGKENSYTQGLHCAA